jgi:glutaminyl-tRNA synthetase
VGVARRENIIDVALLEHSIREDLNKKSQRRLAVLDPIKVTITNYPENMLELMDAINNPEDESAGSRVLPFSKYLYIERDDFMEDAPKKYFRLTIGSEVRLRYAYFITCTEAIKDENGEIIELLCTYDPASKGGNSPDGRKVKGTIHWVSEAQALDAEVRLYDRLFTNENPDDVEEGESYLKNINPDSLKIIRAKLEPSLMYAKPEEKFQFERIGYFCVDKYSKEGEPIFNRTVGLKDSWSKVVN